MMRILIGFFFGVILASLARADDWKLEIAPTTTTGPMTPVGVGLEKPSYYVSPAFNATLTNISDHPMVIWKEWCSFGYFNLRFEITRTNGDVLKICRENGSWTWNFPDPVLVKPGDAFSWVVTIDSNWTALSLGGGKGEKVKIRAVYENAKDPAREQMFSEADAKSREFMEKFFKDHPDADAQRAYEQSQDSESRLHAYEEAWTGQVFSSPIEAALTRISTTIPR